MNGNRQQLIFSFGGNESTTKSCFAKSIALLSIRFGNPTHISSIYKTDAWGFKTEAPAFLNQVLVFESDEDANSILAFTQQIEKSLGRKNKSSDQNYSNRPIDIDILTYGTTILKTKKLTIPHPLMHKRNFILEPLAEIFPNFIHPTLKKTLKELLLSNPDELSVKVYNK
jgi:2-amino-4-hydroxy-6-hydroxymethyldihydropteridine diphosphokinase